MVPQTGGMFKTKKERKKKENNHLTHFYSDGWREVYDIIHFYYFINRKCQILHKNYQIFLRWYNRLHVCVCVCIYYSWEHNINDLFHLFLTAPWLDGKSYAHSHKRKFRNTKVNLVAWALTTSKCQGQNVHPGTPLNQKCLAPPRPSPLCAEYIDFIDLSVSLKERSILTYEVCCLNFLTEQFMFYR